MIATENNKMDNSLINQLKRRVLTAFSALGVALGLAVLTPHPSKLTSTAKQQDPVSTDEHYATWSDYAKSIECKAQRMGIKPTQSFVCSPQFAAAQGKPAPDRFTNAPVSALISSSPVPPWINDDTHYMSEPINMTDFTERIAIARAQMKSSDPKVAHKGYESIETFLIAKDSPRAMRRMTTELVGSEEAFYKDYDAAVKRVNDIQLANVHQRLKAQDLNQLSHDQKCAILDPLHEYLNLLQARIGFRTFDSIKDEQMAVLEQQDSWARDLSRQLSDNSGRERICMITNNVPSL
jgi:hypothetical protein